MAEVRLLVGQDMTQRFFVLYHVRGQINGRTDQPEQAGGRDGIGHVDRQEAPAPLHPFSRAEQPQGQRKLHIQEPAPHQNGPDRPKGGQQPRRAGGRLSGEMIGRKGDLRPGKVRRHLGFRLNQPGRFGRFGFQAPVCHAPPGGPDAHRQKQPDQHGQPDGIAQSGAEPFGQPQPQGQGHSQQDRAAEQPVTHGPRPPILSAAHRAGRALPWAGPLFCSGS